MRGRPRGSRSCPAGSAPRHSRASAAFGPGAEVLPNGVGSRSTLLLCGGRAKAARDRLLLLAREPLPELLADVVERIADVLERVAHAAGIVLLGRPGLVAQRRLLAAADVRAVLDAVVVAAAHPVQ